MWKPEVACRGVELNFSSRVCVCVLEFSNESLGVNAFFSFLHILLCVEDIGLRDDAIACA